MHSAQQGNVFCALLDGKFGKADESLWVRSLAPLKALLGDSLGSETLVSVLNHRSWSPQLDAAC